MVALPSCAEPLQHHIAGRSGFFGGDILSTKTSGGTHFYNVIQGVKWDLTASQFAEPIPYDDTPSTREAALADTSGEKYRLLKDRLAAVV